MIQLRVRPDPASSRNFAEALRQVPGAIAERILPLCADHVRMGFAHVFDLGGPGWHALHKTTLGQKRRKGLPLKILVRSGSLKASLTDLLDPYHIEEYLGHGHGGRWAVHISSRHPLFLLHTMGAHFTSGGIRVARGLHFIPARPMAHMTISDIHIMDAQARSAADQVLQELSWP